MQNLEKNSIQIYSGIVVHWHNTSKDEVLDVSEVALKFPGCYATNNSTVCFVNNQGKVFVTPYTRIALQTLNDAGFKHSNFYVPFSNSDMPKKEKSFWLMLREDARQSYKNDFVYDCNNWCDKHHIEAIRDESIKACFCMPSDGVPVKSHGFDDRYYPICNQTCLDCTVVDRLGKYCTNNGKCVFVYRDGNTYVAKGYWIIDELRIAGYSECGLFVPFSNGEEITDLRLKSVWGAIPKK